MPPSPRGDRLLSEERQLLVENKSDPLALARVVHPAALARADSMPAAEEPSAQSMLQRPVSALRRAVAAKLEAARARSMKDQVRKYPPLQEAQSIAIAREHARET